MNKDELKSLVREAKKEIMFENERESYEDSVKRALRAADKKKDAEAVVYYSDCLHNHRACASFERFKGSAAYDSWKRKEEVAKAIADKTTDYKRFSWMNESFDVESDEDWKDPKKAGFMRQKDVSMGHGTVHFTSNTGTKYKVELSGGKITSVTDDRDNVYELSDIQKYWDQGFPLVGAIAATLGDDPSGPEEEERQMLYPPEEITETNQSICDGEFCIKVTAVNPSLGNKRSMWLYKNEDGTVAKFASTEEAESFIEKLKTKTSPLDRSFKSYDVEYPTEKLRHNGLRETDMDSRKKRWDDFKRKNKCPHCNGVKLVKPCKSCEGKGYIKPTTVESSAAQLDEKMPPGFPKPLYHKLKSQYKDAPEKAYATMWKLHKQYGNSLEEIIHSLTK